MTQQDFLMKLSELLETPQPLTGKEALSDLVEWDSLAVMNFMAMADADYGVVLAPKDISGCKTVDELVGLVYKRKAA